MLVKLLMWLKSIYDKFNPNRIIPLVSVTVITVACLWFAKTCAGPKDVKYKQQIAAYQDTTKHLLAKNDSIEKLNVNLRHVADSLKNMGLVRDTAVKKQIKVLTQAKTDADKKLAHLQKDTTSCKGICEQYRESSLTFQDIATQQQVVINQDAQTKQDEMNALARMTTIADNRGIENKALRIQLANVPVYHEEKFLWVIPLPSRKQSLVAGIAMGVLATLKVSGKI